MDWVWFGNWTSSTRHYFGEALIIVPTLIVALTSIWFSRRSLEEARAARFSQIRPVLTVSAFRTPLESRADSESILSDMVNVQRYSIAIKNIGFSPAVEVSGRLKLIPSFELPSFVPQLSPENYYAIDITAGSISLQESVHLDIEIDPRRLCQGARELDLVRMFLANRQFELSYRCPVTNEIYKSRFPLVPEAHAQVLRTSSAKSEDDVIFRTLTYDGMVGTYEVFPSDDDESFDAIVLHHFSLQKSEAAPPVNTQ